MDKVITFKDRQYRFDSSKDQILKRGLIDPYDLSPEPDEWVVLDDYLFWSARLQREIHIPRWMKTDLSSIPKCLRWLISVNERHRLASLPHDLGYALKTLDKDTWDEVLRDFSELQGVSRWKRNAMYWAVKLSGRGAWDKPCEVYIPEGHKEWFRKEHSELDLGGDV